MVSDPSWHEQSQEPASVEVPPQPPAPPSSRENPPWTGWDVLWIAIFAVGTIFAFALLFTFGAQRLLFPKLSIVQVAKFPLVSVAAQAASYLVLLAIMHTIATRSGLGFGTAVRWNWPRQAWLYLVLGIVLSLGLQLFAHFLPIPKALPIDQYFETPADAWVLSIFGMTLAPLLEELFFRGFLYPVLARRTGGLFAVIFTAAPFGLIHAQQLGRAWAPVLLVFVVGLVLTLVRAFTKSVAPGFLVHLAHNGTISVLLFVETGGFRHMEKAIQ